MGEVTEDFEMVEGGESEEETDVTDDKNVTHNKVYLPGQDISKEEELVRDESAYYMYHQAQSGAPCLSFDIIKDDLGESREDYPLSCFIVAGTQGERSHTNHVIVMKMSNLHKTQKYQDDSDDEEESDDDDEKEPELETALIQHIGGVNRIRCTEIGNKRLAASWSETGKVYIWDLEKPLHAINDPKALAAFTKNQAAVLPIHTFIGHNIEGFAMDWCPTTPGRLATGDCNKNIHIWDPQEGGSWHIDQRPYSAHTASVEDLQWSPNEPHVFASCSVDKSVRIWDARVAPHKACMLSAEEAHSSDVNVLHWNKKEPFIVSGGDDGMIKVWDLRQFQKSTPVAVFKHHTAPITSIEWHPTDSSVFAASGSDDQITLWDLALEKDDTSAMEEEDEPDVPPQLLFIHQGQSDIKELHWHSQLPGILLSTAHSGFNIFRPISV